MRLVKFDILASFDISSYIFYWAVNVPLTADLYYSDLPSTTPYILCIKLFGKKSDMTVIAFLSKITNRSKITESVLNAHCSISSSNF